MKYPEVDSFQPVYKLSVSYTHLKYEDIRDGVKLRFVMSSKPNYKRAVSDEAVAPSLSLPGKTMKYQANLMKTGISNQ